MPYKGEIIINGKPCEVRQLGSIYINGMSVEDYVKSLDITTIMNLAVVGTQAVIDEKKGTKPRKYNQMMKCFHLKKTNNEHSTTTKKLSRTKTR
jgi:hypothetical protein